MALLPFWILNTNYWEAKESGKESFSSGGSTATRVFYVAWSLRADFIDALLGWSVLAGATINRELPDQHPDLVNLYCTDCTVDGKGKPLTSGSGEYIEFDLATITATYKPLPYDLKTDADLVAGGYTELNRYCSHTPTFNAEMMTLQGAMQWVTRTDNKRIPNPPSTISATMQENITWHEVPSRGGELTFKVPTQTAIQNCLGKVNSTYFDGHEIGTVLFIGVDPKITTAKLSSTDKFFWEITYSFLIRNNGFIAGIAEYAGHNHLFDLVNQRWDAVSVDGLITGARTQQYADLNTLFTIT